MIRTETAQLLADKLGVNDLLRSDLQPIIRDRRLWSQDLHDIISVACREMESLTGRKSTKHEQIIETLLISLSFKCGGRGLYLPKGRKLQKAIRNYWIFKDSETLSFNELANKYKLSVTTINDVIKQHKFMASTSDYHGQ